MGKKTGKKSGKKKARRRAGRGWGVVVSISSKPDGCEWHDLMKP